jgi:hypothetical protein
MARRILFYKNVPHIALFNGRFRIYCARSVALEPPEINEKFGFSKQITNCRSPHDPRKALTEHIKLSIVNHMPTMFGAYPIFSPAPLV